MLDAQLDQQLGGRTVVFVLSAKPKIAAKPPGAEDGNDRVLTDVKEGRDVVGLVGDAFGVIGPAGTEGGVANFLTVEVKLVETAGGHVEPGAANRAREREQGAEVGARRKVEGRGIRVRLEVAGVVEIGG